MGTYDMFSDREGKVMFKKLLVFMIGVFILFIITDVSVFATNSANEMDLLNNEKESKEEEKTKLLVSYKEGTKDRLQLNNEHAEITESFENVNVDVLTLSNDVEKNEVIQELKKSDHIEFVEENKVRSVFSLPNDPYFYQQRYIERLELPDTWNHLKHHTLQNVVVAVLDTGLDTNHEDLKGRIAPGGYNFIDNSTSVYDLNGHGTAVSGVIAATTNNSKGITGVAGEFNIKVLPLQVGYSDGVIYQDDVIRAIDYAIEKKVDIINMSFGGSGSSKSEQQAMNRAIKHGISLVAAAGNEGNTTYMYPASYEGVISVGAINEANKLYSFSNRNNKVDVVAYGSVYSASVNGTYKRWEGTSFSAPIVSGVIGLAKIVDSTLTPAQVEEMINGTSIDLGTKGKDVLYGSGLISPKTVIATLSLPKIDRIGDSDVIIKGTSIYAGDLIEAIVNGKSIGGTTIRTDGHFSIPISKQKAGTKINIVVKDEIGSELETVTFTVIDNSPPNVPVADPITNKTTTIKGKAEANSTVLVQKGNKVIGQATTSSSGSFYVTISPQEVGTVLSIVAVDKAGNSSKALTSKVDQHSGFEEKQGVALSSSVEVRNGYMVSNKKVGSLKEGEAVRIIDLKNGYYRIIGTTVRGWVHHNRLLVIPSNSIYYGTVTRDTAPLQNGFTEKNKVIGTLVEGEPVTIVETKEGYHRVISSYTRGWIKATNVSVTLNPITYPENTGTVVQDQTVVKNGYMPWNVKTGMISKNDSVQIIDLKMGYYRVITSSGLRGWVHYTNIKAANSDHPLVSPKPIPYNTILFGETNRNGAEIKNGFLPNNKVLYQLNKTEPLTILEYKNGYYRVIASYIRGWVHWKDIQFEDSEIDYPNLRGIALDSIPVRNGYMPNNHQVGTLSKDETVEIVGLRNGYYRVIAKNTRGWVHYTALSVEKAAIVNAASLQVREKYSDDSEVVGLLQQKEEVIVLDTQFGWHKVKKEDLVGWVSTKYLDVSGEPTPPKQSEY